MQGCRSLAPLAALLLAVACGPLASTDPPRLVLLISVDTLRADHLGAYGSGRGLTPALDALAAESVRFEVAYAPSAHTLPSVAALLSGRYPEELGIWSNGSFLPGGTPTLATRLREAGWNTAAVVSNWVLRHESGLAAGFARYDEDMPQLEAARPVPERLAPDTSDAALDALDACLPDPGARCLLWVHYQDPHGPYTPPEELRERELERERRASDGRRQLPVLPGPFGRGGIPSYQALGDAREVAWYRAGYAGEVALLDREIARLLAGAPERARREETAVLFTADHGESLGEDDYWFGHGERLAEVQVRVPLLLRAPGRAPGVRGDVATLVDVLPTLSALAGVAAPAGPGRDLLAEGAASRDSVAYLAALRAAREPQYGIVAEGFKYLVSQRGGAWHGRLTRPGHDGFDLTGASPQVAARLRRRLEALQDRYHAVAQESLAELGPEERARLAALGYLEAEPSAPAPPAPPGAEGGDGSVDREGQHADVEAAQP